MSLRPDDLNTTEISRRSAKLTPEARLDALEEAIRRSPDTQNLRSILELEQRLASGIPGRAERAIINARISGLAVPTAVEKLATGALVLSALGLAVYEGRFVYEGWVAANAAVNDIYALKNNIGITNALPSFNRAMDDIGIITRSGLSMAEHSGKAALSLAGAWVIAKIDPVRKIRSGIGLGARISDKLTTGK